MLWGLKRFNDAIKPTKEKTWWVIVRDAESFVLFNEVQGYLNRMLDTSLGGIEEGKNSNWITLYNG